MLKEDNSHENYFTFRKQLFQHKLCYEVSFNIAIEKKSLWNPKTQIKNDQQDTSSWGSFHLKTELVSIENVVY